MHYKAKRDNSRSYNITKGREEGEEGPEEGEGELREGGKKRKILRARNLLRGGRQGAGWRPTPCPPLQNGCKLSFHFVVKILSSLAYLHLCELYKI